MPKTLKESRWTTSSSAEKHKGNKPSPRPSWGIVLKTLYNKLNQWKGEEECWLRGVRMRIVE